MSMDRQQPALGDDFAAARLGDTRRSQRAAAIVSSIQRDPSASFPKIFSDKAGLEAFYRFVNNRAVSFTDVFEAYAEATVLRARELPNVIVVHDTTTFEFDSDVEGMGRINGKGHGFLGHFALAVAPGEERRPLGVLGMTPVVRTGPGRGKLTTQQLAKLDPTEKESHRWPELVDIVEGRLAGHAVPIHVMDREADVYPLLCHLVNQKARFVVRISKDRRVEFEGASTLLRVAMADAPVVIEREVPISGRAATYRENGLPRKAARTERTARLAIASRQLEIKASRHWKNQAPPSVTVNVVWVRELEPPANQEPVDWMLATTEPVDTPSQIETVVDIYRTRWLIEEFFKALKTGCQFEKRQLETLDGLLVTLGLLAPVACDLLHLRSMSRRAPSRPATTIFRPLRLDALRAILPPSYRLPSSPTVRDAMLAIACLGGHLKNNGDPGWLVLGRGMETLLHAETVWTAALQHAEKM